MSSKEKTNKITSFFKPRSNKDKEKTNEEGDKLNIENSSIMANSNDQVSEIYNNNKSNHTKTCSELGNLLCETFILAHWSQEETE